MMTVAKQLINAICMYVYLLYYTERLRRDKRYMLKELLRVNRERTLAKRRQREMEMKWKV